MLTVLAMLPIADGKHHRRVRCRCICGREVESWLTNLQSGGGKRGCGCLQRAARADRSRRRVMAERARRRTEARRLEERDRIAAATLARAWRGALKTAYPREYASWCAMVRRCTSGQDKDWPNYGGRGIWVCDRWRESFEAFLSDLGPRPVGTTLNRTHNAGPYEPFNCKWSTYHEQNRNSRQCKLTADDALTIAMTLRGGASPAERRAVAERYGVTPTAIYAIHTGRAWSDVTGIIPR